MRMKMKNCFIRTGNAGTSRTVRARYCTTAAPAGRPCTAVQRFCDISLLLLDRLDGEVDADLVADQETARFERGVPLQTEVLAVQRGLGFEADALVAPRVLGRPQVGDRKRDLLRHVADREVAGDVEALVA